MREKVFFAVRRDQASVSQAVLNRMALIFPEIPDIVCFSTHWTK